MKILNYITSKKFLLHFSLKTIIVFALMFAFTNSAFYESYHYPVGVSFETQYDNQSNDRIYLGACGNDNYGASPRGFCIYEKPGQYVDNELNWFDVVLTDFLTYTATGSDGMYLMSDEIFTGIFHHDERDHIGTERYYYYKYDTNDFGIGVYVEDDDGYVTSGRYSLRTNDYSSYTYNDWEVYDRVTSNLWIGSRTLYLPSYFIAESDAIHTRMFAPPGSGSYGRPYFADNPTSFSDSIMYKDSEIQYHGCASASLCDDSITYAPTNYHYRNGLYGRGKASSHVMSTISRGDYDIAYEDISFVSYSDYDGGYTSESDQVNVSTNVLFIDVNGFDAEVSTNISKTLVLAQEENSYSQIHASLYGCKITSLAEYTGSNFYDNCPLLLDGLLSYTNDDSEIDIFPFLDSSTEHDLSGTQYSFRFPTHGGFSDLEISSNEITTKSRAYNDDDKFIAPGDTFFIVETGSSSDSLAQVYTLQGGESFEREQGYIETGTTTPFYTGFEDTSDCDYSSFQYTTHGYSSTNGMTGTTAYGTVITPTTHLSTTNVYFYSGTTADFCGVMQGYLSGGILVTTGTLESDGICTLNTSIILNSGTNYTMFIDGYSTGRTTNIYATGQTFPQTFDYFTIQGDNGAWQEGYDNNRLGPFTSLYYQPFLCDKFSDTLNLGAWQCFGEGTGRNALNLNLSDYLPILNGTYLDFNLLAPLSCIPSAFIKGQSQTQKFNLDTLTFDGESWYELGEGDSTQFGSIFSYLFLIIWLYLFYKLVIK